MRRFHALEWEDLSWFPSAWRDYGTDYLKFISAKFHIYKPVLPLIKKGLEKSGAPQWVDCASGGGGDLVNLAKDLSKEVLGLKIIMTDYYQNPRAFYRIKSELPDIFEYEKVAVNAMDLPVHLQGKFRTMFAAFHHFRPHDARRILRNAMDSNSPIAIFEPLGKNPPSIFSMFFVILNVLIFTPFIRPVRWSVLPFIYLLPIVPLYILWDGVASILRTYSVKELWELVDSLDGNEDYHWEIGKTPGPMPVHYLLGYKK